MIPLIAFLSASAGVVLLLGLTPEQVTWDVMRLICPKRTLRDRVQKKRANRLTLELMRIQEAMKAAGRDRLFAMLCFASVLSLLAGVVFSIWIGNFFLLPIMAVALAAVPFLYAKHIVNYYNRHIAEEIETAMSMITTAYVRTQDLIASVEENIPYLRPPVKKIFQDFLIEANAIRADVRQAIRNLKGKIENQVFREWCDGLLQCQEDRALIDMLLPIVNKLTDLRIVANEMKTALMEPRKEYWTMAAFLVGNVPLLWFMSKEWYQILMGTLPGQAVLAVCGVTLLITAGLMFQYTRPIQYRQGGAS